LVDEMAAMQIFYVNIGGGEPMIRPDFYEIIEHATSSGVGVKFSTNGSQIDAGGATRLAAMDYTDIQISIDGADAATNDRVRGDGSFATAIGAMENLANADFGQFKISVVMTRENIGQLDRFEELAAHYDAELRLTRLRPAGRGADTWNQLHPLPEQQVELYHWLLDRPTVLTGDSFFHLNALGEENLPGLNLCGAGRVVCLIDPVGDVYACPFVLHDEFRAGSVRDAGGFAAVWSESDLFTSLREPQSAGACASCGEFDACQGGCMAAKFFTGLPLDGPDPECVTGHGELALAGVQVGDRPGQTSDHSKPVPITLGKKRG
ncbi:MAG: mycofactocin radical SAM maturase, partial [Acidimicrobiales bacterium]